MVSKSRGPEFKSTWRHGFFLFFYQRESVFNQVPQERWIFAVFPIITLAVLPDDKKELHHVYKSMKDWSSTLMNQVFLISPGFRAALASLTSLESCLSDDRSKVMSFEKVLLRPRLVRGRGGGCRDSSSALLFSNSLWHFYGHKIFDRF